MEYTQWVLNLSTQSLILVLILVVMEYTQWALGLGFSFSSGVLILVVMEYTQWVWQRELKFHLLMS